MPTIQLPNSWSPRSYQLKAWSALESGVRRACLPWHRRAGKDDLSLHWTACALMQKPATYWHMLPKANQARKAIWDAVNPKTGKRRIDEAFPQEIRSNTRENEMMIRFINGATWQVVGSDNYDALVGSPPYGIVFSEYSLSDPSSWEYLRPILAENGGWAIFIYTPRGKNHGYTLHRMAQHNPDWFCQILTVDDTGVMTKEQIQQERAAGMSEDMIQQEFYCSFEAANPGAYYGKYMQQAWAENRILRLPADPILPVETFWDLGMADAMAIWFVQFHGKEVRLVHYYENHGEGMSHYANYLQSWAEKKNLRYAKHTAPQDIEVRELGTGKSRRETAATMGLKFAVAPQLSIADGIEAVRRLLPMCWFDEKDAEKGISCLTEYSKEWDEKYKVFKTNPKHDWASHGADAFRTLAVSVKDRGTIKKDDRYSRNSNNSSWMSA